MSLFCFALDRNLGGEFLSAGETSVAWLSDRIFSLLFFSVGGFPLIVLWLIAGALFMSLSFGFINLRAFAHAIAIARGDYDNPDSKDGEISSFQALSTAISATVGLGNIAGVALAISLGGPGACFWMTVAGLLGANVKFVECTLGQKYRKFLPDGTQFGGPMHYLSDGLAAQGWLRLGQFCALAYAVCGVFGSFGASGMFQAGQSYAAIARVWPSLPDWAYGLVLVVLAGSVIIGGIQRVGKVTGWVIPIMCAFYVVVTIFVLAVNYERIPAAVATIFHGAWNWQAGAGGALGAMIQGFRRACFSNEAGMGSAAIAHAASRQAEPVREGIIASLEPLVDTVLVCNLTALAIIVTGVYAAPEFQGFGGAELTSAAFGSVVGWFADFLAIAVFFFALSTIVSWGYYGERSWAYLFGSRSLIVYKVLLLGFVFLGTIASPEAAINLSDATFLTLSIPNLLGLYFLSGSVRRDLRSYWQRLQNGELPAVGRQPAVESQSSS